MMEKPKILLAEDDPNLGNLLMEYLEAKGYSPTLAQNGKEGFDLFKKKSFDLLLLDVMMPVKDGFTLAREVRELDPEVPIVFLTAKSMKEDTLEGFKMGADDYITKPFSMEELLARIQAILRRSKAKDIKESVQNEFTIGQYKFNYSKQTLEIKGKKHELSTKEADLLKLFCVNKNETVDRSFALNTVWKDDDYFKSRSMDVYISRLRKLLKDDPTVEIVVVHGRGFKLIEGK